MEILRIKDDRGKHVAEFVYDDDHCNGSPPCGGCMRCVWYQAIEHGYTVEKRNVMHKDKKHQLTISAVVAVLFVIALALLFVSETDAQPLPDTETNEIDFFGDMRDDVRARWLNAEGDLQLLAKRHRAPYYGVLITYKDFQKLWGEYQQSLEDLRAANEHIKVLDKLVNDLRVNHVQDLLDNKKICEERVQRCIDNYPQPVVIPCDPCKIEWYEHPALWVSVGLVVGVVVGGALVYVFGG